MTSNLGAEASGAVRRRRVGFGSEAQPARAELEQGVIGAARDALAPELYNRIDEILVLSPLGRDEVREIAARLLAGLGKHLAFGRGIELGWDPEIPDLLLDQGGYDPSLGARPMKRTLARLVEAPLAELILRGEVERGQRVWLGVRGQELTLTVRARA
jgi:ATP-dependent Clp protease ATP-binding subunit ClpC